MILLKDLSRADCPFQHAFQVLRGITLKTLMDKSVALTFTFTYTGICHKFSNISHVPRCEDDAVSVRHGKNDSTLSWGSN